MSASAARIARPIEGKSTCTPPYQTLKVITVTGSACALPARASVATRAASRALRHTELLGDHGPDLLARALGRQVAEQRPHAIAVAQRQHAVGHALGLRARVKLARLRPRADR